jgi:hypothetical protein
MEPSGMKVRPSGKAVILQRGGRRWLAVASLIATAGVPVAEARFQGDGRVVLK